MSIIPIILGTKEHRALNALDLKTPENLRGRLCVTIRRRFPLSRCTVRSSSYCAGIDRPGERLCGILQEKWDLK